MLHNLTNDTLQANSAVPDASPLPAAPADVYAESALAENRQQTSTGQQDAQPSIATSASPQQGDVSDKLSATADSEEVQGQQQVRTQSGQQDARTCGWMLLVSRPCKQSWHSVELGHWLLCSVDRSR